MVNNATPPIEHEPIAAAAAMETIRTLDLEHTTIEQLLELLEPIFIGYAVEAPRFDPTVDRPQSRWRNRSATVTINSSYMDTEYVIHTKTKSGRTWSRNSWWLRVEG